MPVATDRRLSGAWRLCSCRLRVPSQCIRYHYVFIGTIMMDSFAALHATDKNFGTMATLLLLAEGRGLETIDQSTDSNRLLLRRVACDFLCSP